MKMYTLYQDDHGHRDEAVCAYAEYTRSWGVGLRAHHGTTEKQLDRFSRQVIYETGGATGKYPETHRIDTTVKQLGKTEVDQDVA